MGYPFYFSASPVPGFLHCYVSSPGGLVPFPANIISQAHSRSIGAWRWKRSCGNGTSKSRLCFLRRAAGPTVLHFPEFLKSWGVPHIIQSRMMIWICLSIKTNFDSWIHHVEKPPYILDHKYTYLKHIDIYIYIYSQVHLYIYIIICFKCIYPVVPRCSN